MDYTRKYWEDGVTDDDALAMNNIELAIDNAKTEINSTSVIIKKEKSLILWKQAVADNSLSKMIMETLLDTSNINNTSSTGYIYDNNCLMTSSTANILFNAYLNDVSPAQAYVSADCVLGTGSIVFSISRDNGDTYTECPLDTLVDISTQPEGNSMVLRAIITGNAILNAVGYGWKNPTDVAEINSMSNIIKKEADILQWEQFALNNALSKILIDTLMDTNDINVASTGYTYVNNDYYLSTTSTANILWNAYANDVVPTQAYVVADYTLRSGSIIFSISRDGGTTFTACPLNTLVDISTQPSGMSIVLKVVVTNDAILNAVGYGWK